MTMLSFLEQAIPPPGTPPPPGLPIDSSIWVLIFLAIGYGIFILTKTTKSVKDNIMENSIQEYTIYAGSNEKEELGLIDSLKKIFSKVFVFILIIYVPIESVGAQISSNQYSLNVEQSNTWAIGVGMSNTIMHGDLRSIGTGELGNFWNFGGYVYVDKMFNPIIGLELKANYNNISGGAQSFSDIYDVLYVDGTTLNNNLFFEGKSYGAELNVIFSFSNIFQRNSRKWHMAGYFGAGYHQYDSKLYERNSDGSSTLLIDFGNSPSKTNGGNVSSIYLSAQFGIKYRLTQRIDLEFRPSWYFNYEDHLDGAISQKQDWETFFVNHLGITIKLGKKGSFTIWGDGNEKSSTTLPFSIKDRDNDGVMDELDKEPNTPKGVKVYGNGVAIDADQDGIPDYKDDCPLEPGTLENKGCPLYQDSDNDGILDHKDLCPTDAGPKENRGCPRLKENDKITIIKYISELAANIYFDTGKFYLREDAKKVLDQISKYMNELPDINFKIEGHTDNRDSHQHNVLLSQKRADAVTKYLRKKGIKASRLSFKGYGETRPLYTNDTPQGRQLNRRVEIRPKNKFEVQSDPYTKGNSQAGTNGIHIVQQDETLFSIGNNYNISVEKLKELNNLNSNTIKVGQKLKIKE